MASPEIIAYGAHMKNSLACHYANRGAAFGRAVARAWLFETAEVVSGVEGKEVAAKLLFDATDAVLADVPVYEFGAGMLPLPQENTAVAAPTIKDQPEPIWQWAPFSRAMGWLLVGLLLHNPVFGLLRLATGW